MYQRLSCVTYIYKSCRALCKCVRSQCLPGAVAIRSNDILWLAEHNGHYVDAIQWIRQPLTQTVTVLVKHATDECSISFRRFLRRLHTLKCQPFRQFIVEQKVSNVYMLRVRLPAQLRANQRPCNKAGWRKRTSRARHMRSQTQNALFYIMLTLPYRTRQSLPIGTKRSFIRSENNHWHLKSSNVTVLNFLSCKREPISSTN